MNCVVCGISKNWFDPQNPSFRFLWFSKRSHLGILFNEESFASNSCSKWKRKITPFIHFKCIYEHKYKSEVKQRTWFVHQTHPSVPMQSLQAVRSLQLLASSNKICWPDPGRNKIDKIGTIRAGRMKETRFFIMIPDVRFYDYNIIFVVFYAVSKHLGW